MNYSKYTARPRCEEKMSLDSFTIPDDALTIQEIVSNVAAGLPTGLSSPIYDDDDDDDFSAADMSIDKFDILQMSLEQPSEQLSEQPSEQPSEQLSEQPSEQLSEQPSE